MEHICSNCKKKYNVEYGVCPFCGERNDIYDEDKPTSDERRDLVSNEQQEFVEDEKMKKDEEYDEEKLKALGCPKTYMTESVLATIFCCFPVGIFGIINANKVESFYRKEQYKKAFEASQKARKLFIASIVTGIVVGLSMIIWGIVYVYVSKQATHNIEYISTEEEPTVEHIEHVELYQKCSLCSGEGEVMCPDCKGRGEYNTFESRWNPSGNGNWGYADAYFVTHNCPRCKHTGKIDCPDCNGLGYQ